MVLRAIIIDNVIGECKVGALTDEYIKGLDEEVPIAGLLKVLNAADWKGS